MLYTPHEIAERLVTRYGHATHRILLRLIRSVDLALRPLGLYPDRPLAGTGLCGADADRGSDGRRGDDHGLTWVRPDVHGMVRTPLLPRCRIAPPDAHRRIAPSWSTARGGLPSQGPQWIRDTFL